MGNSACFMRRHLLPLVTIILEPDLREGYRKVLAGLAWVPLCSLYYCTEET